MRGILNDVAHMGHCMAKGTARSILGRPSGCFNHFHRKAVGTTLINVMVGRLTQHYQEFGQKVVTVITSSKQVTLLQK